MSDQTITQDETTHVVLSLYDAFSRRDLPAAACLADDVDWNECTGLAAPPGRAASRATSTGGGPGRPA
jgi:ketosteroid isomerase-like protein